MISGAQCRMGRAALAMEVQKLSDETGVAPSTIWRFEKTDKANRSTVLAIQRFLEAQGVEFTDDGKVGLARPAP